MVERIRQIGRDPALVRATIQAAKEAGEARRPELEAEIERLAQAQRRWAEERYNLVQAVAEGAGVGRGALLERLAEVDAKAEEAARRVAEVRQDQRALEVSVMDEDDLRAALAQFDGIFGHLVHKERQRALALLIEQIRYDATEEKVAITFRANGIHQLAQQRSES